MKEVNSGAERGCGCVEVEAEAEQSRTRRTRKRETFRRMGRLGAVEQQCRKGRARPWLGP